MLEILSGLKELPQTLELPESLLVREHHVDATGVRDMRSLLVGEEVVVGRDVLLVVLGEELKTLDAAHRVDEFLDRSCGFEDEHVFGNDSRRGRLKLHALRLKCPFQLFEA